jgi:hypothetical protein
MEIVVQRLENILRLAMSLVQLPNGSVVRIWDRVSRDASSPTYIGSSWKVVGKNSSMMLV